MTINLVQHIHSLLWQETAAMSRGNPVNPPAIEKSGCFALSDTESLMQDYCERNIKMKSRPQGFLSEEHISHESEVFDYIVELHEYLWRFVRAARPGTSGNLGGILDEVIDSLENVQRTCATCGGSGRGIPTLAEPDGAEEGSTPSASTNIPKNSHKNKFLR
jgi:hypothetical protein